jgi:hypothetical protein
MPDEAISGDELVDGEEELVSAEEVEEEELVSADEVEEEELVSADEVEVLPVLAEVRTVEPTAPRVRFAIQAAAAAATGLAAGAATVALARRYAARKPARLEVGITRRGRPSETLPIVETRTYLVRVHEIAHPPE